MLRKSTSITALSSSLLASSTTSSLMVVGPNEQKRSIGLWQPKCDIWMGTWEVNREFDEFRHQCGRVPDHTFAEYRKMYWRIDEASRRQEKFIQDQGFFYLPTLDFQIYKGCLPLFSAQQLRLHYTRHHKAYVDKLNVLIKDTPFFGEDLDAIIKATANDSDNKAIYNNAAQHYNHMFFWKSLTAWGSVIPPDLQRALEHQYQSVQLFQEEFKAKAMGHFGSGWIWWVWDKKSECFDIRAMPNAGCAITEAGIVPLLVLDAWEHSWYCDYENDKSTYVDNFWRCADWHWAERHWKRATNQEFHEMRWN